MYLPKIRGLRCEEITSEAFSGERVCCFKVYEHESVVQASPLAPEGHVDEESKTVRVRAIRAQGDKTYIEFPDGANYEVSSSSLVGLAHDFSERLGRGDRTTE